MASASLAANSAIAGLLMLARAFPQRLAAQREHRWLQLRREQAPADVQGQTVLIVGVGAVGTPVARFAQALDMRVIGVRRSPFKTGEPVDEMHAPAQLDVLLPRARWLVLACPHTPDTHHLLDARRLGLLPHGAGVIHVAHGGLADPAALADALAAGQVASAYLDICQDELASSYAILRTLPGVLFSRQATRD